MSIITKTGDDGHTSLASGERVWKDDLRVEVYGTLEEVCALLAEAKHSISEGKVLVHLEQVEQTLFRMMGQLAAKDGEIAHPVCSDEVDVLTRLVQEYEAELSLTGFAVLGTTVPSAKLDVGRTVLRRAERRLVSLAKQEKVAAPVLAYVNRLSDLLFVMARWIEKENTALTCVTDTLHKKNTGDR